MPLGGADADIDLLRRLRAPRFEAERCHAVVVTSGVVGKWLEPGTDADRLEDVHLLATELGLPVNTSELLALADSQCGQVFSYPAIVNLAPKQSRAKHPPKLRAQITQLFRTEYTKTRCLIR